MSICNEERVMRVALIVAAVCLPISTPLEWFSDGRFEWLHLTILSIFYCATLVYGILWFRRLTAPRTPRVIDSRRTSNDQPQREAAR